MEGYRRAGGLELKPRRPPENESTRNRKRTFMDKVKRAFSYERKAGVVEVSTVPFITDRWNDETREVCAFMVSLPRWITEKELLEAINLGFGFLAEEVNKQV